VVDDFKIFETKKEIEEYYKKRIITKKPIDINKFLGI